jgi:N-acetylglucosaminyl-diphospho-decaprenol L-rhamnosyltransferase
MKLLIVIVNYRTPGLLIDCLRSLAPEVTALPGTQVVITDNNSGDDSLPRLRAEIDANHWNSWATLKPLPDNGGFAYGNNGAIRPALESADKPDYVFLLNPDTIVRTGAIGDLVKFMDSRPDVGIAGSRMEYADGTPQVSAYRFHSILSEFEHAMRLGPVTKALSRFRVPQPLPEQPAPCDWVCGASMMIRREVFEKIGLLDERYFMYYEEVDFCLRAKRTGFPCWIVPQARIVHLIGSPRGVSEVRAVSKRRPAYWFASRRHYFTQNHGRLYAVLADAVYATGFALWRIRRTIQRKPDADPPKFLWDLLRHSAFSPKPR